MNQLIDRLIIAAGQWNATGESRYEKKFADHLKQLQDHAKTDHEGAMKILLNDISGEVAA